DFETGRRAYQAGDYAIALEQWAPLAAAGDADAAFGLALIYDHGHGVARDAEAAAVWYRRAAESGHIGAAFNLGNLYRTGDGVALDPALATRWWRQAAEGGLGIAQVNLGVAYQKGEGVEHDDVQAVAWYRRAADKGEASGAFYLGVAYENGIGVPIDLAEARRWYQMARDGGDPRAAERLAILAGAAQPAGEEPVVVPEPEATEVAPAAAPPVALVPAEPAAPEGATYVQLAAYLSRGRAERAWADFAARHVDLLGALPYRIERALKDGTTVVYRVQAGPFAAEADAALLCRRLMERGAECFVARTVTAP
ncbi:MAG: SPOR domain-containing protein, partial [Alphaproteobacteria bacterium]